MSPKSRKIIGTIAAVGFIISLSVHLLTYAHVDILEIGGYVWALHIGVLLLWIFLGRDLNKSSESELTLAERFFTHQPVWGPLIAVILIIYTGLNFALWFHNMKGGSPEIVNGKFLLVLKSGGTIGLTESEYHVFRAYVVRGFSGHWLFFYFVPAVYFLFGKKPDLSDPGRVLPPESSSS